MSDMSGKHTPREIPKPWGSELLWAETDLYVGKTLRVNAGESLSLQYHEVKDETLHMLSGEIVFEVGTDIESMETVALRVGESFRITPGTIHRMTAVSDAEILEVSTNHLDDVVRLEDRYGRIEKD